MKKFVWKNHVHSQYIGLQVVGLMKAKMSDQNEKKISSCNTMDEIRKAVQENLKDFEDSVEPVKVLMLSALNILV